MRRMLRRNEGRLPADAGGLFAFMGRKGSDSYMLYAACGMCRRERLNENIKF